MSIIKLRAEIKVDKKHFSVGNILEQKPTSKRNIKNKQQYFFTKKPIARRNLIIADINCVNNMENIAEKYIVAISKVLAEFNL